MAIIHVRMTGLLVAITLVASACGSSSAAPTTPSTQTITTDVLTGTVSTPVGGVLQSSLNQFVVGQGGGNVSVQLTSAIETFPDGTLLTTVTMGLGVGTLVNGTCTIPGSQFVATQSSGTPQLAGPLNAGTYCVVVSDVTNQLGPVAYALAIAHP